MSSHSSSLSLKSAMGIDRCLSVPSRSGLVTIFEDFSRLLRRARPPRLDLRGGLIVFESETTKGRTLISDRRLADEENLDRLFCGNIPRLQRRNNASVSKRRPHSIAERFYFIGLKGVKYRRQGPIYLHTDREFRGILRPVPSSCSPFYPV